MSLFFHKLVKSRSVLLTIVVLFSINITVSAAMVSTAQIVNADLARQATIALPGLAFNRVELEQKLITLGVAPEQVHTRLSSMTDAEITALSSDISELPAGGEVLTILAVLFLVLLFTDIAGYTDLFPFVKKTSQNSGGSKNSGAVNDRGETQKRKEPIVVEN
ncbi:MAG: PA2779 family protein [Gammaproteobacteria bacterium]